MTLNDSWGFQRADDNWKTPRTVIRNLITCARDGGNYLLNIGPQPDGGIPPESVRILSEVGEWMKTQWPDDLCRRSLPCRRAAPMPTSPAKGNTLYMHVHFWPGTDVSISGLKQKVLSAKILKTGQALTGEPGRLPHPYHRPARRRAGYAGHHHRAGMRWRAGAGHRLCPHQQARRGSASESGFRRDAHNRGRSARSRARCVTSRRRGSGMARPWA